MSPDRVEVLRRGCDALWRDRDFAGPGARYGDPTEAMDAAGVAG
jgi:hypothetical protein